MVGMVCNTEEMEQLEETIEHRLEAFRFSSGAKFNSSSYGEDVAGNGGETDDEEEVDTGGAVKR